MYVQEKIGQALDFTKEENGWTFKTVVVLLMGRRGNSYNEMICSEWIIRQATSEGEDGGEKVCGRQRTVM